MQLYSVGKTYNVHLNVVNQIIIIWFNCISKILGGWFQKSNPKIIDENTENTKEIN